MLLPLLVSEMAFPGAQNDLEARHLVAQLDVLWRNRRVTPVASAGRQGRDRHIEAPQRPKSTCATVAGVVVLHILTTEKATV